VDKIAYLSGSYLSDKLAGIGYFSAANCRMSSRAWYDLLFIRQPDEKPSRYSSGCRINML